MHDRSIATYLDANTMALFAEQIVESIGSGISVAVHDSACRLVWSGPGKETTSSWAVNPFMRDVTPDSGYCERLSNSNYAMVFPLRIEDTPECDGTLSVQIHATNSVSLENAREQIEPVIRCIERQISINIELSAVRRITSEGRKGMQLLMRMDKLENAGTPRDVLVQLLELTAEHYDAEVAAVILPELGVREVYPASIVSNQSALKAMMTTLGALVSGAKTHRRVILSDANIKTHVAAGLEADKPKILCSPVLNSRDAVIGAFVLIGGKPFSKEQVRLSRAICTKINTLLRTSNQIAENHLSRHDFLSQVAGILKRQPNSSHAVVFIDIDSLHVVNDCHGHMAGDGVIRLVGSILDDHVSNDDAITHLYGDTFALFLRNADETKARQKTELILDSIGRDDLNLDGQALSITASAGIALIPDVVCDAAAALNTAEVAARSAKSRGGNRLVVFRDLDASVAQRRSDLDQVNFLQSALINDRFVLHAQPIEPVGEPDNNYRYEILIRMSGDDGQTLPPAKFLSAAERYQMMSAIDRWVIRNTLDQLANADNLLEINLGSFSINISAQSLSDDEFPNFLEAQIVESGVAPDSLCFEITETAVVRNLERAQLCIRRLRKLGCRLALDDFGTGYCSFAYLKDLPVQYVKLDGVFVRDMLENPLSESIVASMASIARVMNAATVAEHVENDLILQRLRQHGIDYAQGFGIGRPEPLDEVLKAIGPPVSQDQELKNLA